MRYSVTEEVADLLDQAQRGLLLQGFDSSAPPIMRRAEIERWLPHRQPFLFLDDVLHIDPEKGVIAARYDLKGGELFLSGHFPGDPTWPGVFQIETIAQSAGLFINYTRKSEQGPGLLTHVMHARFVARIKPGADVIVISQVLDYGQIIETVGQSIQNGKICAVAATKMYSLAEEM